MALTSYLLSAYICINRECSQFFDLRSVKMAEAGWDEVTYARKRPMRAAEAKSQKVIP